MTSTRQKTAFTLTELVVAMSILGVLSIALTSFYIKGVNQTYFDVGKQLVNKDIRNFTTELSDSAVHANYFIIYDSFQTRDQQDEGSSGDFLLLVYNDPDDDQKIERTIGFYRSSSSNVEGPVLTFNTTHDTSVVTQAELSALIPDASTFGAHQEVIELSKGLADGKLFFNFFNKSIVVRGEIIHQGDNTRNATNTYNFTISPRG
ncbi:prepilin-type N-terminal cleavage/methylation domain-containing protein [Puniceicoccaceae bacterium K14]|nr:prepilin-type N-terminal cleavage/methylation domain-containing protein [Puniceicoccaceae bacterium K14]